MRFFALCAVLALFSGCGGRSVGALWPDGAVPDVAVPSPDVLIPPVCEVSFEIEVIPGAAQEWYPPQVDVAGGWVVYTSTGTGGGNLPEDSEVFRFRPGGGPQQQLSFDDARTFLLDAEGSAVLYGSRAGDEAPTQLWFRNPDGFDVDLGMSRVLVPQGYGDGCLGQPKMIHGSMAAWADDSAVKLYDGQSTRVIYEDPDHVPMAPALDGETVAFAAFVDGNGDLFRYRLSGGLVRVTEDPDHDRDPVVSGETVYWVCGPGICRYSDDLGLEVMASGYCTSPSVHGDQVAWICDGRVSWFRDGQVHEVSDDDVRASAVRLHGGRLTWIETPGRDLPPGFDGQVVYRAAGRNFGVAPIIVPHNAGHMDTQNTLVLDDGMMAWCHSMHESGDGEMCSYARVLETGFCDSVFP